MPVDEFLIDGNPQPRSKLSRHEMNVIISRQVTVNKRSSRLCGIEREEHFRPIEILMSY